MSDAKLSVSPWAREIAPGRNYWRVGLAAASLLLAWQTVYFEGAAFCRNPAFRPSLERLCQSLHCRLPAYKNPDEWDVLQNSLSALPDHSRLFSAVIRNRAAFSQAYPNLELSLHDYDGNLFASRIFRPQDYLHQAQIVNSVLRPGATETINLNLAAPKTQIGGYTFKLSY